MKKLSYVTLKELNYDGYLMEKAPERVLQFGEGNFLRAFVDYFIDIMNEKAGFDSKVVLIQPRGGSEKIRDVINEQEGLYTLFLRGCVNGCKVNEKRVISSVSRCLNSHSDYEAYMECAKNPELRFIISNTTEAGIRYDEACQFTDRPAASYPGKLTQFLYERYQCFGKEKGKGFVILSCELIDNNGKELEKCVLKYAGQWELGEEFERWVKEENRFCSTLVDRIVTGYPGNEAEEICEEAGYEDKVIDTGEIFGFWAIEGPKELKEELPFEEAGLPVLITDDHGPYKQRKVRILNGAHTSMVLGAYLAGQDIVRDCMQDEVICGFMNRTIYEEIIPTLSLPEKELMDFAKSVTDRFNNPFIDHALLDISLNSTSKWRARVLPSLKGYIEKYHRLPGCITASLAFYIAFYKGSYRDSSGFYGMRGSESYKIKDEPFVLEFYNAHRNDDEKMLVQTVLSNEAFWGEDLTKVAGLCDAVTENLKEIETKGTYELMKSCLS